VNVQTITFMLHGSDELQFLHSSSLAPNSGNRSGQKNLLKISGKKNTKSVFLLSVASTQVTSVTCMEATGGFGCNICGIYASTVCCIYFVGSEKATGRNGNKSVVSSQNVCCFTCKQG
jgi:hypothetical protein